jgi:hypothetical protein
VKDFDARASEVAKIGVGAKGNDAKKKEKTNEAFFTEKIFSGTTTSVFYSSSIRSSAR